jgi:NADP-dependent 3-hydroxy acid dehydrogenase YdfG
MWIGLSEYVSSFDYVCERIAVTSIAIVGAGPQLGLAIARTFGSQGFDVALISRDHQKLDGLVGTLTAEGITAAAFPADVLDRDALTQALKDAATRFGGIDVLEYSPVAGIATTLTTPVEAEPAHVQHEIEFQLYGAIAATKAVLPAMREAGAGTLLYTTGAGSIDPVPQVGNVNAAAAALRNWVINLHKELDGTGVQAAHVGIDVSIGTPAVPGFPTAQPEEISPVYWELHTTKRDQAELVFSL